MANTFTLINSTSLSSSAASVTFSAIPATYADLVLQVSARTANATANDNLVLKLNSDTGANYSVTRLYGNGSTATSNTNTNMLGGFINANTSTSSTFGNTEIYIPKYGSTANKPISTFSVAENNATAAITNVNAMLYRNSSALTSIEITASSASNFQSGSTFWLYGIKNS